jgi:hypothetical protein
MKLSLVLAFLFPLLQCHADPVPSQWLQGPKGYEKAVELQKANHLPILVWTTWTGCPFCAEVTAYVSKGKPKAVLRDYLRVVVDEKGNSKDLALCQEHGFHGGSFYIIGPDSPKPIASQWAWQGKSRTIVDHLENTLATLLAKATSPAAAISKGK